MTETKSRRRGEELEKAILDAAWAELSDVGYTALTIEAVAKRAGTSKPVIYRRWSNRAHLVMAAWAKQRPDGPKAVNTGTLRSDLLALFSGIAYRMGAMMGEAVAGVMGEAFRHPEITALLRDRLSESPLASPIERIVERAVERGELAPVQLPSRVVRLPLDVLRAEAITCGAPVAEKTIVELVDDVYVPLLKGLAGWSASPDF